MSAGRARALLAPALALVVVLAGCGQGAELDAERAAALQQSVLTVSEEAAAGRHGAAQAALAQVRSELEAAVDAGEVSTARYRQIDDALDRTDQEVSAALAAQAAAQAAAEQAAAEQAAAEQAAAEQAAAEQAAAEEAAAREAAARAAQDEAPGPGKGPKGKGKKDDDD
ncbi:mucin-associated surface protein [Cellulomonas sp. 179-A 4D5 NHS]|uniref:mucin-associated surface protein n=1 Tax=Cellulomonas sp. 179-A 4D5 NHS TaxID=3142378 RepID=UPI0039A0483C